MDLLAFHGVARHQIHADQDERPVGAEIAHGLRYYDEPPDKGALFSGIVDTVGDRTDAAKFVSIDLEKGEQFLQAFGGVAGVHRYSIGV